MRHDKEPDSSRGERADPAPREQPARLLHRRYLISLVAVACLLLLDQFLVQPPLLQLAADAPVINVAGRQRMLSQRLAKAALALDRADDDAHRRRYLDELERVLRLWSASHDELRRGDGAISWPGKSSRAIRAAFDGLQPSFARMRDAAARIIRGYSGGQPAAAEAARADLATILDTEGDYLARMDRIVGLYEREARARVDRLGRTGWAVTVVTLLVLLGIGLFVLRPAVRLIQRQVQDLRRARDELEDRVRERIRELELANQELGRAAKERALAEERHRALLEQFSRASRTNTIGEMASGLAHELNQPLGAIANYAEGCLVVLASPDPALGEIRSALEKVLATTLRAGQIVQRIRRFVTRHELEHEPLAPNRVVQEVEELVRDEARRRGIAIRLELAPELPNLWGDPVQIQQVLVNLVRNAFDALSASQSVGPAVVMRTRGADGEGVEFSVIDNGEGIPRDHWGRVFDAYFSTRADGMGMGLAISRTIVEAHHGRIEVESEPGVRTTFRFTLPCAGADDEGSHGLYCGR